MHTRSISPQALEPGKILFLEPGFEATEERRTELGPGNSLLGSLAEDESFSCSART
jgi:hypothetical protein